MSGKPVFKPERYRVTVQEDLYQDAQINYLLEKWTSNPAMEKKKCDRDVTDKTICFSASQSFILELTRKDTVVNGVVIEGAVDRFISVDSQQD
ncbi:unnamed protein product [Clonostachys rosea]|uniref:Uncharacterized protein n=1 Tax=Bionectria ochroleuca TaxID=29856 RepID=A0ABY6U1H6_BIOOC|nr:unnamed protein product [Clonostachys rosea]